MTVKEAKELLEKLASLDIDFKPSKRNPSMTVIDEMMMMSKPLEGRPDEEELRYNSVRSFERMREAYNL